LRKRLGKVGSLAPLKKIGFITPSSNTALEPLTTLMLSQVADLASAHFTRIAVRTLTLDQRDVDQFQTKTMADAAALLNDAGMDVILWNGTSGAWTGNGMGADVEICEKITASTGVPASTSSLAQVEVLRHFGLRKMALAVPYTEGPTDKMVQSYEAEGFEVVSQARMDLHVNTEIGDAHFEQFKQLLRAADSSEAECIVVGCTNLAAAVVLDEMEHELGKPIFDSIAVTLWQALRMVGVERPLHGWGSLLRRHRTIDQLNELMARLLAATGASRTTIRLDIASMNIDADDVYAEACAPGVAPLKLDSSLNQRSLGTVQWLERNRALLIQEDCVNADIPPPQALMNVYGVKAQVLSPLVWNDAVVGWISVHYIPGTRQWEEKDLQHVRDATDQARAIVEEAGWQVA